MKKFIFLFFALCVVSAYNLYGEIYSANNFESLENVVIEISGTSSAKIVASNNYSIELPVGNYTIEAYYLENGKLVLYSKDEVYISSDSKYDLILFHPSEFETVIYSGEEIDLFDVPKKKIAPVLCYIALIILGVIVFLAGHLLSKGGGEEEEGEEKRKGMDEDGKAVLRILKENEGRMEQKELREVLKWTESKTSLVVGELEALGYVKRIKKGRKNIIKILGGAE